jgi:hypothetical protein
MDTSRADGAATPQNAEIARNKLLRLRLRIGIVISEYRLALALDAGAF